MKFFTLEELVKSNTAKKLKIDNKPNEVQKQNLEKLINELLDPVRERFGKPIFVSSGFRCKALNDAVKGSKTSDHLNGCAADIYCLDNKALFYLICDMAAKGQIKFGQCLDEKQFSWIHISLPTKKHQGEILHL